MPLEKKFLLRIKTAKNPNIYYDYYIMKLDLIKSCLSNSRTEINYFGIYFYKIIDMDVGAV